MWHNLGVTDERRAGDARRCGGQEGRAWGRHALRSSGALGAACVQLGPGVVALVAELHTHLGVPLANVADLLRTWFGLTVTAGGLAHMLPRAARDAAPTYAALCQRVRNAPVVTPDETGWRVGAVRHWLWAFASPGTTVYAICRGRGFSDAVTVFEADFDGVLVRDGWVPYCGFDHALHQSCLAHLLRPCKHLRDDHPEDLWAVEVEAVLQAGLGLRDRRDHGGLTDPGPASVRGRLLARLGRLIEAPDRRRAPPLNDAERFAAHLDTEIRRRLRLPRGPVGRRAPLARGTRHTPRGGHPENL